MNDISQIRQMDTSSKPSNAQRSRAKCTARRTALRYSALTSAALTLMLAAAPGATAGPEGLYFTHGKQGDGTEFVGTVSVVRTGETYRVIWRLTDGVHRGAGLGAAPIKGATEIGPASSKDDVLTVGFLGGEHKSGVAFYVEQPDGSWHGIRTEYGSHIIATETWTPVPTIMGPGLF